MKYTLANANSLFIHEHVIIVKREHTLLTICIFCARNIYRSLFLFPSIPNDISMVCERFSKSDTCMSNMFDRVDVICHVNNFACKQFVCSVTSLVTEQCFRLLHTYLDNIKSVIRAWKILFFQPRNSFCNFMKIFLINFQMNTKKLCEQFERIFGPFQLDRLRNKELVVSGGREFVSSPYSKFVYEVSLYLNDPISDVKVTMMMNTDNCLSYVITSIVLLEGILGKSVRKDVWRPTSQALIYINVSLDIDMWIEGLFSFVLSEFRMTAE